MSFASLAPFLLCRWTEGLKYHVQVFTVLSVMCLQLEEMRELSFRNVDVSDKAQAELKNARKRIDELNAEITRLISQVTDVCTWFIQGDHWSRNL